MPYTNFPNGITSFGVPVLGSSGAQIVTGNSFFVDSGHANAANAVTNDGSMDKPFATIDYAVGRCTASNGDVIYVMPGHAENISAATSLVIDVAGVRIVGLGQGRNRPVLTYTATAGTVEMDAANCSLENIVFFSSISAVVVGINVDAADCSILGCEFDYDATGDDFITMIDIDAFDRARVAGCRFIAEDGVAGCAEAIRLDTAHESVVEDNYFSGDYTDAVIVYEGAASNSVVCRNNKMYNGHANARGIVKSVLVKGIIDGNVMSGEELFNHANQLAQSYGGAELKWQITKHVSSPFTGATPDQHGNDGGANDPYTIMTVTGDCILAAFWGVINTDLTGATATIEVGTVGNTAGILAQELATDMDDGAVYVSGTVADGVGSLATSGAWMVINDGADIIETTATANVEAGQIDYYCIWAPAEDGAKITSADAVV